MRAIRSVEERDVAGRYIHHTNVQRLQRFQNGLHPWPESAELLSLLRFPFGPRLVREIRRRVQPGSREIQDEWSCDDTHLDDAQLVVETNELRRRRARKTNRRQTNMKTNVEINEKYFERESHR